MRKLLKKLLPVMILVIFSAVSCGSTPWNAPPSWTIRSDGHIRASQRKEDFTPKEFITKIQKEEAKSYGLVLAPSGEAAIAARMRFLDSEVIRLKNELSGCR